jgi:hypothetical protein
MSEPTGTEQIAAGIVVPYERFLEVRHRRQRVMTDLSRSAAADDGESHHQFVNVASEPVVTDNQCGTRSDSAVAVALDPDTERRTRRRTTVGGSSKEPEDGAV